MVTIIRIIVSSFFCSVGWTVVLWIMWTWLENFERNPLDLTLGFCSQLVFGGFTSSLIASLIINTVGSIQPERLRTIALQTCLLDAAGVAILFALVVTRKKPEFPFGLWGMLFAFFSACSLSTTKIIFL